MTTPTLPPLPEPTFWRDPETCDISFMVPVRPTYEGFFDGDSMQAYARAAIEQQGVLDVEDLKDRLVAISSAVADSDDRGAQAIIGTTLKLLASSPAPQAAPASVGQEPVAGQCRFTGMAAWGPCSAEHVSMVLANPSEWENYEVRHLYTHPAQQAKPLSDEQIDAVTFAQWGEMKGFPLASHRAYARAIESAHGIKE